VITVRNRFRAHHGRGHRKHDSGDHAELHGIGGYRLSWDATPMALGGIQGRQESPRGGRLPPRQSPDAVDQVHGWPATGREDQHPAPRARDAHPETDAANREGP
jgi:hypothetical protein